MDSLVYESMTKTTTYEGLKAILVNQLAENPALEAEVVDRVRVLRRMMEGNEEITLLAMTRLIVEFACEEKLEAPPATAGGEKMTALTLPDGGFIKLDLVRAIIPNDTMHHQLVIHWGNEQCAFAIFLTSKERDDALARYRLLLVRNARPK